MMLPVTRAESPISRLSDDILYQILILIASSRLYDDGKHYCRITMQRYAVIDVCRHWQEIILMSQRWWSFIRVDRMTSPALVHFFLARSGSVPLEIRFSEHCTSCMRFGEEYGHFVNSLEDNWEDITPEYSDSYLENARLLATQTHRIKSIYVGGFHTFKLFREVMAEFTSPAPQLRSLEFSQCAVPDPYYDPVEAPFSGTFPLLQTFRTHESLIPWGSYSSNLTVLHFEFRWTEMSLAQLTKILTPCTYMQSLDLHLLRVEVADEEEDMSSPTDPRDRIEFPHLQKLAITSKYDHAFMRLLSRLVFPSSVESQLALTYDNEPATLPMCNSLFRELLATSKEAEVEVEHWHFDLLAGFNSNMAIKWCNRQPHEECKRQEGQCAPGSLNLCESLNSVSLPSLESLKISLSDNGYTDCQHENAIASLWNSLRVVPSVTSLSMHYESESYDRHCEFSETFWGPSLDAYPNLTSIQFSCIRHDVDTTFKTMSDWLLARLKMEGPQFKRLEVYAHIEEDSVQLERLGLDKLIGCDVVIKKCPDPHPQQWWSC